MGSQENNDTLSDAEKRRIYEHNIQAIVDFFESGITNDSGALGIELEHTLTKKDLSPVSYSEEHGVEWVLEELKTQYPQETRDPDGSLLGVARAGESVTIEPAAQLELSAGPFHSLREAEQTFIAFEDTLKQILEPQGMQALTVGYHPSSKAADLELIPKRRYKFMNLYLGGKSPYGVYMMRGSASTQISIDYSSTQDCLRKLRIAFALVPVLSLICDNSPVFEGEPSKHPLVRTEIWRYCDPDRCGVVPGIMNAGFTLHDYAEYLMNAPAILKPCKKEQWCYTERTFKEIYEDKEITRAEVEHITSMFFTDVRLKTYIEIRPADALPIPYVLAYAALIKGLFYNNENLATLDNLLANVQAADIEAAKTELMEHGYEAQVYNKEVTFWTDELIRQAKNGLAPNEQHYLEPLATLVAKRQTLAQQAQ